MRLLVWGVDSTGERVERCPCTTVPTVKVRKANKGSLGHRADLHVGMDWHDQRFVLYLLFSGRSTTDVFGGQLKPMANGPLALQCHAKWH